MDGMEDQNAAAIATPSAAADPALDAAAAPGDDPLVPVALFDQYADELVRWVGEYKPAVGATADDVLLFFQAKHPAELDRAPQLFQWIPLFLDHVALTAGVAAPVPLARPLPEWLPAALERLDETGDVAAVAAEYGLKSPLTLLYWRGEHDKRAVDEEHADVAVAADATVAVVDAETADTASTTATLDESDLAVVEAAGRHRTAFMREHELTQWLLERQRDQLTRQDVLNHVTEMYPAFAATKSPAALKVWTSRFLKRHVAASSPTTSSKDRRSTTRRSLSEDSAEAKTVQAPTRESAIDTDSQQTVEPAVAPEKSSLVSVSTQVFVMPESASSAAKKSSTRKRRGASAGGYVLHSNEFKLNALRKLDEGKTVSQVAQELGLKSQNSLTYWNSIRDKLATSEKKRFRLAGGGRRSSCTFEGELLAWVSERHQKGLGTAEYRWRGRFGSSHELTR